MRAAFRLSRRTILLSAFVAVAVFCAAAVFPASVASAAVIDFPALALKINDHGQGPPVDLVPPGVLIAQEHWPKPGQPVWKYEGVVSQGQAWKLEYSIEADPDPFIYATFTMTNNTGATKDFTLNTVLSISPQIIGGFLAGGSVSGTLVDLVSGNGTGANLSSLGSEPIYMARIDGADFYPLLSAPQSFTTIDGGTGAFGPVNFGTPIPSMPSGGNILSDIEIEINATIGPHTIAVVVATFEAVPEPASLALMGIGLGIVALRRRRPR